MPDLLAQDTWSEVVAILPNVLVALAILVVGTLVAAIAGAITRNVLRRFDIDRRLASAVGDEETPQLNITSWAGRAVFYVGLLFVAIGVLQALNLTQVADPINTLLNRIFEFLPQIIGAAILALVAWVVATVVRFAVHRGAQMVDLDERLAKGAGIDPERATDAGAIGIAEPLATAAYWFTFLVFLPAILGTLNLEGLVAPVQEMLANILVAVPKLLAAGVIVLVGWFLARVVRQIVVSLLVAAGADSIGERVGMSDRYTLSWLVGTIVYVVILIQTAIAALERLDIESITSPATNMVNDVFAAVPDIIAAGVLLVVAYLVGRLIAGLVTSVLQGLGFDRLPTKLGLQDVPAAGVRSPSEIAGYVALVAIMLFASIEAASLLNFESVADLLAQLLVFGGQVFLALIILAVGIYLANIAYGAILSTGGGHAVSVAWVARGAIIVFVAAMALQQMGIGEDIVRDAFRAIVFAIALAAALAFGLGGRETAARELDRWLAQVRSEPAGGSRPGAGGAGTERGGQGARTGGAGDDA